VAVKAGGAEKERSETGTVEASPVEPIAAGTRPPGVSVRLAPG
jgi:hypothetical protein